MSWYAAHIVLYVKLKKQPQKRYPLWENIVLLRADSEENALAKAEQRGRDDAGDDAGTFTWKGKPAEWVFAGVRQLIRCQDETQRPKDGTEVSYSEMEVESREAVGKFVHGEPVRVKFRDAAALPLAANGQS